MENENHQSFYQRTALKKIFIYFALIMFSILKGQTINTAGSSWTVSVPTITEAGANYTGTYNNPSQITLSGNLPGSFLNLHTSSGARISMNYIPTTWHSNLHLYAKRNGGTASIEGLCVLCTSTINGGNVAFIEIPQALSTTLSTITFTGVLGLGNSINYSDINVQLEIDGVSVTIPTATYSAQIVFTIGPN